MSLLSHDKINGYIAAGTDKKVTDGRKLFFRIHGGRTSWHVLYASPTTGKRRTINIKWTPSTPVKKADVDTVRAAADEIRAMLRKGIDPLDARDVAKSGPAKVETFAEKARAYLAKKDAWIDKQKAWAMRLLLGLEENPSKTSLNQFRDHLAPIRNMPVAELTAETIVEKVLRGYWATAPVAASKAAKMICAVINRDGLMKEIIERRPDSALITRQVRTNTGQIETVNDKDRHHPAAPWTSMPAIWAKLAVEGSMPALAAQFALATTLRANSVAGAEWEEIDLDAKLWTIPAGRMKGKAGKRRQHKVPLSAAALAVLDRLPTRTGVLFVSPKGAKHVATDSMREALQRAAGAQYTLHGSSRAGFGDWVTDNAPEHLGIVDPILAHAPDKTSAAYLRNVPVEAMRPVLDAYGAFLLGKTVA